MTSSERSQKPPPGSEGDPLGGLIGRSPALETVRDQARRLLRHESASRRPPGVLLLGETGTGKGLLASAVHRASGRKQGPFVSINCAAIPDTLMEAELFGFERGAFTDAREAKPGLFESAHHGTLFLDEIGSLPPALQGKLLTAIEERSVRRLGSTRKLPIDVWIMAATSEDLIAMAADRRFRQDLYHRIAAIVLELPPLRERSDDILALADHFLTHSCATYDLPPKRLTAEARHALLGWKWPGNVRELANLMERIVLLIDDTAIGAHHLGLASKPAAPSLPLPGESSLRDSLDRFEHSQLSASMEAAGGNLSRAAALLGIPRNTLRYRLKRGGIDHGIFGGGAARTQPPVQGENEAMAAANEPVSTEETPRSAIALLSIRLDSLDPSSIATWMRGVVMEKVRAFGSVVEEVKPAGIVAAFGSESIQESATRAVHAALAIQEAGRRCRTEERVDVNVGAVVHVVDGLHASITEGGMIPLENRQTVLATLDGITRGVRPGSILLTAEAARCVVNRLGLWETHQDSDTGRADLPDGLYATPMSRRPSLAMLPFRNLSDDPREEYFADGITADIAGALARIGWLSVVSSASTASYKARTVVPQHVASELGVRYLVGGTVRRDRDKLRVTAELVDGPSGKIVWSDHHDGHVSEVFDFQDKVTARIVATLEGWLYRVETRRALRKRPDSLDAYDCVLHFLHRVHRLSRDEFLTAGQLLERALALEPRYGVAYAWQAWWYLLKIGQGWSADPELDMREAERVAETALVYDPDDAIALAISGHAASVLSRDYEKALARLERSLAYHPNSAFCWGLSAVTLCYVGEPEAALARVNYSLQLSPFDPFRFYSFAVAGFAAMLLGRYDEAVQWCRKCRHDSPGFSGNLRVLAACLAHVEKLEEARDVAREFLAIEGSFNLSNFKQRYALRDPAALEAHVADLRKAGLPEENGAVH